MSRFGTDFATIDGNSVVLRLSGGEFGTRAQMDKNPQVFEAAVNRGKELGGVDLKQNAMAAAVEQFVSGAAVEGVPSSNLATFSGKKATEISTANKENGVV